MPGRVILERRGARPQPATRFGQPVWPTREHLAVGTEVALDVERVAPNLFEHWPSSANDTRHRASTRLPPSTYSANTRGMPSSART